MAALERISKAGKESSPRANELLYAVCKCDFVVALFIIEDFSVLILPLSVKLHSPELDIFNALNLVDGVLAVLRMRRNEPAANISGIFKEIVSICSEDRDEDPEKVQRPEIPG